MVRAASASNVASQLTRFRRMVVDVNTLEDRKDVFTIAISNLYYFTSSISPYHQDFPNQASVGL